MRGGNVLMSWSDVETANHKIRLPTEAPDSPSLANPGDAKRGLWHGGRTGSHGIGRGSRYYLSEKSLKKRTILDQATTPDGGRMELVEHDGSYSIRINGVDLMSTRQHASEERIAELACDHLRTRRGARVLIGGLGFGFTLRAALQVLPEDARITVAEIMPEVIAWNNNPDYPLAADVLKDPRVRLLQKDVMSLISAAKSSYDAIILDVDNGADALVTGGNQKLYQELGLHQVKSALTLGGKVAYWSAGSSPLFVKLMGRVGFGVEVERCRSNGAKGGWHNLMIGKRLRE